MVDELRSKESYRRASALMIRAYLKLHDGRPRDGGGSGGGLPDMSNMSAAEKKRVKAKVWCLLWFVVVFFLFCILQGFLSWTNPWTRS